MDFIVRGHTQDEWRMVLVEQGPWSATVDDELRRIQSRLYGCLEAILDGQLAQKFPETVGKQIVVQLDCYDVPRGEVAAFFDRFASGVLQLEGFRAHVESRKFVDGVTFALFFENLPLQET